MIIMRSIYSGNLVGHGVCRRIRLVQPGRSGLAVQLQLRRAVGVARHGEHRAPAVRFCLTLAPPGGVGVRGILDTGILGKMHFYMHFSVQNSKNALQISHIEHGVYDRMNAFF